MQDFLRLRVWRAAHRVTLDFYRVTASFPRSEAHGLRAQLRDAAASIGANIAEGCGRGSNADMRRHLQIALGSACEALNHALLARDLGLLDGAAFPPLEAQLTAVRKMLIRLIQRLSGPRR